MPLLKILQNVNAHRGQYILPASKRFFSLCCKRRLNFVCLLWNGKFYHESSGCPFSGNDSEWQFLLICIGIYYVVLYQPAMTVSDLRILVEFTEQRYLLIYSGFLPTQYCGHKQTKVSYWIGGVYQSADDNYCSPIS